MIYDSGFARGISRIYDSDFARELPRIYDSPFARLIKRLNIQQVQNSFKTHKTITAMVVRLAMPRNEIYKKQRTRMRATLFLAKNDPTLAPSILSQKWESISKGVKHDQYIRWRRTTQKHDPRLKIIK